MNLTTAERTVLRIARGQFWKAVADTVSLMVAAYIGAYLAERADPTIFLGITFLPLAMLTVFLLLARWRNKTTGSERVIQFVDWLLGVNTGLLFGSTYIFLKLGPTNTAALDVGLILTTTFVLVTAGTVLAKRTVKTALEGLHLSHDSRKRRRLREPTRRESYLILFIAVLVTVSTYSASRGIDLGVFVATAIGSLSYVVVVLYDKYIVSAVLKLTYDPDTPDTYITDLTLVDPKTNLPSTKARSIRILVQNEGGKAARGCVGYLKLDSREPGCTMLSFEPKVLGWVNIADKNLIPRGGFATLGVALSVEKGVQLDHNRCDKQSGNTLLTTWAHTPEIFRMPLNYRAQDAFCVGTYVFDIIIFSQDSAPVSRRFALQISPTWNDTKMTEQDDSRT